MSVDILHEKIRKLKNPLIVDFSLKPDDIPPALLSRETDVVTAYGCFCRELMEQLRGVDSSYSVGALLNKKLIEEAGRLNVPGRPIQYRTTPDFLRTFGLSSLEELPAILADRRRRTAGKIIITF